MFSSTTKPSCAYLYTQLHTLDVRVLTYIYLYDSKS